MRWHRLFLPGALGSLIVLGACACVGSAQRTGPGPGATASAANDVVDSGVPLSSSRLSAVLGGLDSYEPPPGLDPAVHTMLRNELRRVLEARDPEKIAAAPPVGELNRVADLELVIGQGGSVSLEWTYVNRGDYDQNSEVNIADLTPVGLYFGKQQGALNWPQAQLADGDLNGEVNIADVTPIGMHFLARVAGYRIYHSTSQGDYPGAVDAPNGPGAQSLASCGFDEAAAAVENRRYSVPLGAEAPEGYYWIRPTDAEAEGAPSNLLHYSTQPTAPKIAAVAPTTGVEATSVGFSATVSGSPTLAYAWDFGGGATPGTSSATSPTVLLGPPGAYDCVLDVSNAYGADTYPFTLTVQEAPPEQLELWFYLQKNLYVPENLDWAIELVQRAADAGYTKVVLADFKLGVIDLYGEDYYQALRTFHQAAQAAGVEVIPSLVPIGYSDAFLCHDPNLIEPQPVVDCRFSVAGGVADVVQNPTTQVLNGGFETHNGDNFDHWNQMDGPGVSTFADTSVFHSGGASIRFEDFPAGSPVGNDRIRQDLAVDPWHCYAVSFWLKTEDVAPVSRLWIRTFNSDVSQQLTFLTLSIQATQDWRQYHLIFNSQQNTEVALYMGIWSGESGRFWLDDVTIENTGLINLIRREGAPLRVTSADGATEFTEGVDFDPVSDPLMGHAGSYTGTFDLYHARPAITLTPGSAIDEGEQLLVDYYHAVFVYDMQPACCLTEQGVFDIVGDTLSKVNELIQPEAVFIAVDELRTANWCELCQGQGKTPGQLLADATLRIDQIALDINPAWRLITWSDMYDPYHNAHDDYYLVNGTLTGSWEGLPATWDIGNWRRFGDRTETLGFFAGRGHRQILAGYYDAGEGDPVITQWLDEAKEYGGVYAVMYTTWREDFSQLEQWAQQVRDWEEASP